MLELDGKCEALLLCYSEKGHWTPRVSCLCCFFQVSEQEMDDVIARSTHRDSLSKDSHSSHTLGRYRVPRPLPQHGCALSGLHPKKYKYDIIVQIY